MPKTKIEPDVEISTDELRNYFLPWGKLIFGISLFLLYAIFLARLGIFNILTLLPGLLVIFYFSRAFVSLIRILRNYFLNGFDFLAFATVALWIIWFLLLFNYFFFPAFSGRDEGSYANAALYLVRFGGLDFHLPLLDYLKGQGPANQSLNFPGFLIIGDNLTSQFSPAYFVWLAFFYSLTRSIFGFALANGLLILGGGTAFYFLIRCFASRWIAASGLAVVLLSFLFLWFPRMTLSENLAFFLFFNLLLFLYLFRKTSDFNFLHPIVALIVIFPLTRPEGWWFAVAVLLLLCFWHYKKLIKTPKKLLMKLTIAVAGGIMFAFYVIYHQLPVYRRLLKDWLKWPSTSSNYANLGKGAFGLKDLKEIILALLPSWDRFSYFLSIEWRYGILFFGLVAILLFLIFLFGKNKENISPKTRTLIGITAFLSSPLFTAYISPQISPDHPWMLRRFLFAVFPCGVLAAVILVLKITSKSKQKIIAPVLLGLLLLPSLPATAYFLNIEPDGGRIEVIQELSHYFQGEDFVFINREASGDGWRMWPEALSSIYSVNAAYVYSPDNIIDAKDVVADRFSSGKKTYIILQENAFDFEHDLKKHFNLILERSFSFKNDEIQKPTDFQNNDFPLLENREHAVNIYLLTPRVADF